MKRRFLISSLVAAGFMPAEKAVALPSLADVKADTGGKPTLFDIFRLDHKYTLAGHRSHSSHRSHRSHSSHRSSVGGGYVYRAPRQTFVPSYDPPAVREPAVPSYIPPAQETTPSEERLQALPGNSRKFTQIVIDVQTALAAFGYYSGTIDGKVGPATKTAISKMQTDWNLRVTGTITPEVLTAFGIVAR